MLVPWQTAPVASDTVLTLTGKFGFTVMVTGVDEAGKPVGQVAEEMRLQITMSPFINELEEKIAALEPA